MRLLLALLLTMLLPTTAGAATVTHVLAGEVYGGDGCGRYGMCDERYTLAQLKDTAGERNDVTIELVADGVVFRDAATPPTAGEGCAPRDGGVWCPYAQVVAVSAGPGDDRAVATFPAVQLDGGAGDDELAALGAYSSAEGGEGDDVLRGSDGPGGSLGGSAGDDTLVGGAGGEILTGGPGADVVTGGDGDDTLADEPSSDPAAPVADRDVYDGGAGEDEVSYSGARAPVDVDLARGAGNGQAGEDDTITGVENAHGGFGADTLAGDDGRNELDGGPGGPDRLDGRGGDDRLGGRRVVCGTGRDVVYRARGVARDCERAPLGAATARITAGALELRDRCERIGRGCRARLTLRDAAGALLDRDRARGRSGRRYRLRVALPPSPRVVVARYAGRTLRIG